MKKNMIIFWIFAGGTVVVLFSYALCIVILKAL